MIVAVCKLCLTNTNEYLINNPNTMIFHSLSNRPYDNRQTFGTHPEMRKGE